MRNFFASLLAAVVLILAAAAPTFSQSQALSAESTDANGTPASIRCFAHERHVEMMGLNAKYSANHQSIQQNTANFVAQRQANRSSILDVVTIPVVFHVIYSNADENISDARLMEQLQTLNDDFRRTNSDADNSWPQAADSEVEFCLASTDPNGQPTSGILRVSTGVSSFGTNDAMKFTLDGGSDAWPTGSYLNFWVCNLGGGLLGYAQFPGGPAATDGVVCNYPNVGLSGSGGGIYNLGRTGTHEVGHWLNLYHIWGDGGCGVDDAVADTPESDGPNYNCDLGHVSCGTDDMVQNYMDYSSDACMNVFTQGQADRMAALLASSGARGSLRNSTGCGVVVPDFDYDVSIPEVRTPIGTLYDPTVYPSVFIVNGGAVTLTGLSLTVTIDGVAQPVYEWTGNLSTGQSATVTLPAINVGTGDHTILIAATLPNGVTDENAANNTVSDVFSVLAGGGSTITVNTTTDEYGYETSWTLVNSSGTAILTGGGYDNNMSYTVDATCVADDCYTFAITDEYGDGICCAFGNGLYEILVDGVASTSGGDFTTTETFDFCIDNSDITTGCTDPTACNYSPDATDDDGSCTQHDACGICDGPGEIYTCGCSDIPATDCDCNGNQLDALDVCGGNCTADIDGDGVCDNEEILGCTDSTACNYDAAATDDDGSCTFPGCMDPAALNYNPDAGCDDGSCDDGGDTCNGADYCGEGTSWDASTEKCVVTYPADSDFDGCVTVSDILLALGSFGSCL